MCKNSYYRRGRSCQPVSRPRVVTACLVCRARKVRCDLINGPPCANCRTDKRECVLQHRRTSTVGANDGRQSPHRRPNATTHHLQDVAKASQDTYMPTAYGQHLSMPASARSFVNKNFQAESALPPEFCPLPETMDPEDIAYLKVKGALTTPSLRSREALIEAFVEHVHSYLPAIDLKDFLDGLKVRKEPSGQTSLFLFQSIMFAGAAFVDVNVLQDCGFQDRKTALEALFHRSRLLYEFGYESRVIVTVQALLHMSCRVEVPNNEKDAWHWLGIALSLAHSIDLHRDPMEVSPSTPKSQQKLRKRTWWCLYMRDQLIALSMRRPVRLRVEEFDMPCLQEADFDIHPLQLNSQRAPKDCTIACSETAQREIARICIAKAELCICIGYILRLQYSVVARRAGSTSRERSSHMLVPTKDRGNKCDFDLAQRALDSWIASLPYCCRYPALSSLDGEDCCIPAIAVQKTLIHMIYETALLVLHRPRFYIDYSEPSPFSTITIEEQRASRQTVRESAIRVTFMSNSLHAKGFAQWLSTRAITAIQSAMVVHLLLTQATSPLVAKQAREHFGSCMSVLRVLREPHPATSYWIAFFTATSKALADFVCSNRQKTSSDDMPYTSNGFHYMYGVEQQSKEREQLENSKSQQDEHGSDYESYTSLSLDQQYEDAQSLMDIFDQFYGSSDRISA